MPDAEALERVGLQQRPPPRWRSRRSAMSLYGRDEEVEDPVVERGRRHDHPDDHGAGADDQAPAQLGEVLDQRHAGLGVEDGLCARLGAVRLAAAAVVARRGRRLDRSTFAGRRPARRPTRPRRIDRWRAARRHRSRRAAVRGTASGRTDEASPRRCRPRRQARRPASPSAPSAGVGGVGVGLGRARPAATRLGLPPGGLLAGVERVAQLAAGSRSRSAGCRPSHLPTWRAASGRRCGTEHDERHQQDHQQLAAADVEHGWSVEPCGPRDHGPDGVSPVVARRSVRQVAAGPPSARLRVTSPVGGRGAALRRWRPYRARGPAASVRTASTAGQLAPGRARGDEIGHRGGHAGTARPASRAARYVGAPGETYGRTGRAARPGDEPARAGAATPDPATGQPGRVSAPSDEAGQQLAEPVRSPWSMLVEVDEVVVGDRRRRRAGLGQLGGGLQTSSGTPDATSRSTCGRSAGSTTAMWHVGQRNDVGPRLVVRADLHHHVARGQLDVAAVAAARSDQGRPSRPPRIGS